MSQELQQKIVVAGRVRNLEECLAKLESYPRKTPGAFDYPGSGDLGKLTEEEVVRTRKLSSRISNKEVAFFVEASATAPWISALADLADADPEGELFADMTDLYWHFAENAPKGVSIAKISKVLHLKQPKLFPILDSRLARSYAPQTKSLRMQYPQLGKRRRIWLAIRNDLLAARDSGALDELRQRLSAFESDEINEKTQDEIRCLAGLTDLRLLDMLVW